MRQFTTYRYDDAFVGEGACKDYSGIYALYCTFLDAGRTAAIDITKSEEICRSLDDDAVIGECRFYVAATIAKAISNDKTKQNIAMDFCRRTPTYFWKFECYYLLADEMNFQGSDIDWIYEACKDSHYSADISCLPHSAELMNIDDGERFCSLSKGTNLEYRCISGLGTVYFKSLEYDEAVEKCREWNNSTYCLYGSRILMAPGLSDPVGFCNSSIYSERLCWNAAIISNPNSEVKEWFDYCENRRENFREFCIEKSAEMIQFFPYSHFSNDVQICEDSGEYYQECLYGIALGRGILWLLDMDKAIEYCMEFEEKYRPICFNALGKSIKSLRSQAEIDIQCENISQDYRDYCLGKDWRPSGEKTKLYWFIPDGMRADTEQFDIFDAAEKGIFPNIKRLMDEGSYGYSIPVFPSHTPVNFATLMTGTYPKTHGIADGPMHVEGKPLEGIAVGGFRSSSRRIPAIWSTLEDKGLKVAVLSVPGSTPPEIDAGIVVRGRWGGWGPDFHAVNFEPIGSGERKKEQGRSVRLFFFGPELSTYVESKETNERIPGSYGKVLASNLTSWGSYFTAFIYDSTDDRKENYDRVIIKDSKGKVLDDLTKGDWGDWSKLTLNWLGNEVDSHVMFAVILLEEDGFFRIRVIYDNLNTLITMPGQVSDDLTENIGPMIDFVDNFPPQLIYYDEDKEFFLKEMNYTFEWHTKMIPFVLSEYSPDVVIHDIYSPNQMLTSRWWLGYVDRESDRYYDVSEAERQELREEVMAMYKRLDDMIGEILDNTGPETVVVLSSDHGACVMNKRVMINNILAREGLLKFSIDNETGMPLIDWKNSKAIFLKMDNVYVHPEGLEGNWTRGSGPEYEELRDRVAQILMNTKDDDGTKPIASVTNWEDVREFLNLPEDRVGDLVISNRLGYGFGEEMSLDLEIFKIPLETGYKQAIEPSECLWTPFIIKGPGIKKGYRIQEPSELVDQYPTILKSLGYDSQSDGKVLEEVFV